MRKNEKKIVFAAFQHQADKTRLYHAAIQRIKSSNLPKAEESAGYANFQQFSLQLYNITPFNISLRKNRPY